MSRLTIHKILVLLEIERVHEEAMYGEFVPF